MKHLTAADIMKQQSMRQNRRREAFDNILENCYKRIQKCVHVLRNVESCFFEVPEFVIGYPLYELNECIQYCINILTSKGFAVKYIFPRILMISWLPPRQLTLPEPGRAAAKTGEKKVFVQKKNTTTKKFLMDLR